MALVNRAFNYQEKAEIDYKDVADTAWYADAVKIARAAGYISGYEDDTMKPDNPIKQARGSHNYHENFKVEKKIPPGQTNLMMPPVSQHGAKVLSVLWHQPELWADIPMGPLKQLI